MQLDYYSQIGVGLCSRSLHYEGRCGSWHHRGLCCVQHPVHHWRLWALCRAGRTGDSFVMVVHDVEKMKVWSQGRNCYVGIHPQWSLGQCDWRSPFWSHCYLVSRLMDYWTPVPHRELASLTMLTVSLKVHPHIPPFESYWSTLDCVVPQIKWDKWERQGRKEAIFIYLKNSSLSQFRMSLFFLKAGAFVV